MALREEPCLNDSQGFQRVEPPTTGYSKLQALAQLSGKEGPSVRGNAWPGEDLDYNLDPAKD